MYYRLDTGSKLTQYVIKPDFHVQFTKDFCNISSVNLSEVVRQIFEK